MPTSIMLFSLLVTYYSVGLLAFSLGQSAYKLMKQNKTDALNAKFKRYRLNLALRASILYCFINL